MLKLENPHLEQHCFYGRRSGDFRRLSLQSSEDLLSQNLIIEMSIMVFFVFIIAINMQAEKTMLTNYWGLKNMCKAFIPMLDPQVRYISGGKLGISWKFFN